MPELPDLEVFSRNLHRQLAGKSIIEVVATNTKKLNVSAKELNEALDKHKIEKIYRVGKELYFQFGNKTILSMHLMLNGELHLVKNDEVPKYPIIQLTFKDGSGLALTDFRGLAHATLNPAEDDAPDALAKDVDAKFFEQLLGSKKAVIKNILLDQHIIRGIGNAYADEILWHAKISPFSIANLIPEKAVKKLHASLHTVLEQAISEIAEENGDELRGELRDFMKVHGAKLEKSPTGGKIKSEKIGGRTSYYTEEQELYN